MHPPGTPRAPVERRLILEPEAGLAPLSVARCGGAATGVMAASILDAPVHVCRRAQGKSESQHQGQPRDHLLLVFRHLNRRAEIDRVQGLTPQRDHRAQERSRGRPRSMKSR